MATEAAQGLTAVAARSRYYQPRILRRGISLERIIFSAFGIEIVQRGCRLFIRYDAGEVVVQMQEHEISEGESRIAQRSQKDAYEVVLECQRRSSAL
jgi:hypothetical protein